MTIQVAIFGGPGSGAVVAQSVAALAARQDGIKVIGFLNDVLPVGELVSGLPVIGPFAGWRTLAQDVRFIAPLHKPKAMQERAELIEALGIPAHRWITIVDPMSAVAPDAFIGPGCHVGPFVSVGPGAQLGAHVVLRAGAYVGHDCEIGDFVFVGANAVICGYGTAQHGAYIAPSATIGDRLRVGRFALVGLGSVVTRDVAEFDTVHGVPARGPEGAMESRDESYSRMDECLERIIRAEVVDYELILRDSVILLTAPNFVTRPRAWQVASICAVFTRIVATSHAQAGAVAALAAPHFRRLLRDPEITLAQACRMHDALWGMWWCAAGSLDDMRPIQAQVCLPFHDFLARHNLVHETPRAAADNKRPLRIAYLMHYAYSERGNAVAPLIVSLARAHASLPDRKVFVFAVQWVDERWFASRFEGTEVVTRSVVQGDTYRRLDELFEALRADEIDVVIADVTSSIVSAMFARRVAPAQIRLDLGLPYWFQPEIDLVLLSGKRWRDGYPYPRNRAVEIRTNQDRESFFRRPDEAEVAQARAGLPAGAFTLGVFSRLSKITPAYLGLVRRLLLRHPQMHFLAGGTGDPRMVQAFMTATELAGRVTFLHRNVDLAVYAHAIDVFVDTFPFIGALACREIAAQGVPVLSLRSNEWGLKQEQDRDPLSIAEDEPGLERLIERTMHEPEFRRARGAAAAVAADAVTDASVSAREIDAALCTTLGAIARSGQLP